MASSRAFQLTKVRPRSSTHTSVRSSQQQELPNAAYVHLPFCKRRCHYCDFPIVALGSSTSHQESYMESYVKLVCKEIHAANVTSPLRTVFFGGGTPSLIPPELLQTILHALETKHGFAPEPVEISMEMDPGTFTKDYLMHVIDSGVNRVSLGVQVFDDELLKLCGRSHTLKDVYEAIDCIKSCASRLSNWSLDLISSLPHQTSEAWEHSLAEAVAARPAHVSVYDLQIEQGTKFGKMYKPGASPLPSDDLSANFYRLASKALQSAGYEHYEISNYARNGFRCQHNLVYWKNLGYYSYGLGSTSYVSGRRFTRSRRMKEYAEYVQRLAEGERDEEQVEDTLEDRIFDTVMLSLRLAEGLDLRAIETEFGEMARSSLCDGLREFADSGHAVLMDRLGNIARLQEGDGWEGVAYIRLADPEGFLLSNEIISRLFMFLPEKSHE